MICEYTMETQVPSELVVMGFDDSQLLQGSIYCGCGGVVVDGF